MITQEMFDKTFEELRKEKREKITNFLSAFNQGEKLTHENPFVKEVMGFSELIDNSPLSIDLFTGFVLVLDLMGKKDAFISAVEAGIELGMRLTVAEALEMTKTE